MVLTSAAASTQTTILPTARTSLSMAVYRALPRAFAKIHPRHLTPSVSTLAFGAISIVLYALMNYSSNPTSVIADCVTALGMMIAFYYGLTGFACAWYYRKNLRSSPRNLWMQGILPLLGGLILFFALAWSLHDDWLSPNADGAASYTGWNMPFPPHWHIGGDVPARRRHVRGRRHPDVHLARARAGVLPRRDAATRTRRPWSPTPYDQLRNATTDIRCLLPVITTNSLVTSVGSRR